MVKAFAYLRVSGQGQIDGDGFPRQEKTIRDYAKAHGFEIVEVFKEEGVSGTLIDRPTLAELMVSLEQNGHGVDTVIIERVDRLARDLMVQETILDDFKQNGINVISATDGDLLEDDPTRKLVRQVLGAIAEYDKTMTVLKLRAARERKRRAQGKCEGRKSYGEIKPEVLKELKRLHRKPRNGRRLTAKKIAEKMTAAGFTTADGKPFTGNNVSTILHRHRR
jgi:DNA invertase Pin-like site-specific DNA recombinase